MDDTEAVVNNIFKSLKAIYPANGYAWDNQQVMDDAKHQWLLALKENNLNDINLIKAGLRKCRASTKPFVPSIGQFISMCEPEPETLGVPTHLEAYNEAVRRSHPSCAGEPWSHAVVYHAWYQTGSRALMTASGAYQVKEMKDLFYSNYDAALKMFASGEPLKTMPKLLEKCEKDTRPTVDGIAVLKSIADKLRE